MPNSDGKLADSAATLAAALHAYERAGRLVDKLWQYAARHRDTYFGLVKEYHGDGMVLDDAVLTGSYNFSRHAQKNAENALVIESAALAQTYRDYIRKIIARYASTSPDFTPQPEAPTEAPEAPESTR